MLLLRLVSIANEELSSPGLLKYLQVYFCIQKRRQWQIMTSALFWVVTQRVVVISYRRFGQHIGRRFGTIYRPMFRYNLSADVSW